MQLEEAVRMARGLMDAHGLQGWRLELDRAKVRAGACHFHDRRISLSRALTQAHDEEMVRETVLHEIAHALVGPRHGHDDVWRRTARQIGATGDRCYSSDEPAVPGRWQGRCAAGHVVHRHRRPTRLLLCARCRGVSDRERVLAWELDGRPVAAEQLGAGYAASLAMLQGHRGEGPPPGSLRVGSLVRIVSPGRFHGTTGRILKRGRTRYLVQVPEGRLYVPFGAATQVGAAREDVIG